MREIRSNLRKKQERLEIVFQKALNFQSKMPYEQRINNFGYNAIIKEACLLAKNIKELKENILNSNYAGN